MLYLERTRGSRLLTRDDEIQLAKSIERGQGIKFAAALRSPLAAREVLAIGDEFLGGQLRLCDLLQLPVDEEGFDEVAAAVEARKALRKLARQHQKILRIQAESGAGGSRKASQELNAICDAMAATMDRMKLSDSAFKRVTARLHAVHQQVLRATAPLADLERRSGLSAEDLERLARVSTRSPAAARELAARIGQDVADIRQIRNTFRLARTARSRLSRELGVNVDHVHVRWEEMRIGERMTQAATARFVEANQRLVVMMARRFLNRGLPLLDLVQEGNLGLMRAIEKFDYRRGYKFSTYATWWVRQAMTRALVDKSPTIRVPVHVVETTHQIRRTAGQLVQKLGREPSAEEIASASELPLATIRRAMALVAEPVSLDARLGEDTDRTLADVVTDTSVIGPVEATASKGASDCLLELLRVLSPREEQVLRMRFGIGCKRDHTLREIGGELSVSRERIRQIEEQALAKLRNLGRRKRFNYFDEHE